MHLLECTEEKKYLELNFEPNVILTTGYIATELCKKYKKKNKKNIVYLTEAQIVARYFFFHPTTGKSSHIQKIVFFFAITFIKILLSFSLITLYLFTFKVTPNFRGATSVDFFFKKCK